MAGYFLRRVLLVIPTLLGVMTVTFAIIHLVPGGPVEHQLAQYKLGFLSNENVTARGPVEIPPEAVEEIKRFYGFDKPIHVRYAVWLWNVLHLNLGRSYVYQEPVWDIIKTRFKISFFLGLSGFVLSYLISIPLGVWKAVRNGSAFDIATGFIVYFGYSIPGWALGTLLLVLFAGGRFWDIFPLGRFRPEDWEYLSLFAKLTSQIHHMFLPVLSYAAGQFATLTILTKNSLLENLAQEYVKTALAKGVKKRVVLVHALRNSMIPLATGMGRILSLILAGSFLIEKVFNIDGMGYLAYTSILQRDYPVSLGILLVSSLLMITGNIVSDLTYVLIDPRIRFK